MNENTVLSILAWILFGLLFLIIAAYLCLIACAFAWGIKILFQNIKGHSQPSSKAFNLKETLKKNLLANDLIGIFAVFLPFVFISFIPDKMRIFDFIPFIVLLIPYCLGFYRSSGIGIHCGVIGTIAGLILLRRLPTIPPGINDVVYDLAIILTANLSGWLGGFAGHGQIKDSKAIIVFNLKVGNHGLALDNLIHIVECTIEKFLPEGRSYKVSTPVITVAHIRPNDEANCAILKYERFGEWRYGYKPFLQLIKKIRNPEKYSLNTVLDYVSNLSRNLVVNFALHSNAGKKKRCSKFDLAVMVYLETPSIIWIDQETEQIAVKIYKELQKTLTEPAILDHPFKEWELKSDGFFIMHYWQKPTRIEQYVKNSPGALDSQTFVRQSSFQRDITCGIDVLQKFSEIPTFFDKLRGTAYSFLLFLVFQVGLGIAINLVSNHIYV